MVEALKVENVFKGMKKPFLQVETDYGMEDMGQLKTRIEALLEMIKQ